MDPLPSPPRHRPRRCASRPCLWPLWLMAFWGGAAAVVANGVGATEAAITVAGEARLSAVPDLARVDLAVVTRAETASAALAANNTAMQALQAVLRQDFRLAEKDLQTTQLHVAPHFVANDMTPGPAPRGYEVQHGLALTVRDFDRLGALLDAAVRGGANQLRGITFDSTRRQEMTDAARRAAVADARRRAALYAEAAGRALGCVVSLNEGLGGFMARTGRMAMVMDAAEAGVPVAAGEIEVTASVQVGFAFGADDCPGASEQ